MRSSSCCMVAVWAVALAATAGSAQTPSVELLKQEAFAIVDANAERMGRIGDAIYSYSEVGMQEQKTVALVARVLTEAGFDVRTGVAGMPTAYMATYGSGEPVIGLMADYDCVPGASQMPGVVTHSPMVEGAPGHGEGHNTNPPTTIGAALAVKALIDRYDLPGTVIVYGGPAEEALASRGYMVKAGLFDGVDAIMDAHIGTDLGTSYGLQNLAIASIQWTFHGEQGHGARPWTARSALDAVEVMNVSMNYLREHLPLDMRFHYVITDGGSQPNVIPARATVWYYFRERDAARLLELVDRARVAADAAGRATGTIPEERVLSGSWAFNGNRALAELVHANVEAVGLPRWSADDLAFAAAFQKAMGAEPTGLPTAVSPLREATQGSSSSDTGDITWNVPYVRLRFPAQVSGTLGGHHWSAGIVPATPIAHKGMAAGSKVLAASILDLFRSPEHLAAIASDFAEQTRGVSWVSLIPDGTEPPTFLNAELMPRWRPLLQPFEYDPDSPRTYLEELGVDYPGAAVAAASSGSEASAGGR